MDRKKRLRVVIAAAVGLLALFIALVGAPFTSVALWPESSVSDDVGAFMDSFNDAARTADLANTVSLVSLLVAGLCLLYLLLVFAGWFIGPSSRDAE